MSERRYTNGSEVITSALLITLLVLFGCDTRSHTAIKPLVHVDSAMDYSWEVQTPNGQLVRLSDLRDRVLFVNIWASWCLPCITELDSLERLALHFKETKDLVFLIVSEEEPNVVKRFLQKHPYQLPIYIAPKGRPPALVSAGYPVSFIVSRAGRIIACCEGPFIWDSKTTINLIASLLATGPANSTSSPLGNLPFGELPNKSPRLRSYPYYPPTVWHLKDESMALIKRGNYTAAEEVIRQELLIFEKDGINTMTVAEALAVLGMVVQKQGRLIEAERLQKQALAIAEQHYGRSWTGLTSYLRLLENTYFLEGKSSEAARAHEQVATLSADQRNFPH